MDRASGQVADQPGPEKDGGTCQQEIGDTPRGSLAEVCFRMFASVHMRKSKFPSRRDRALLVQFWCSPGSQPNA